MTAALYLSPTTGHAQVGDLIVVDGEEGRHAATVKRVRLGEQVLLADGAGHGVAATVTAVEKAAFTARVETVLADETQSPWVIAVQALAKNDRDELAIAAMTELGVSEIVPWQAARSISQWVSGPRGERQHAKWVATVREAAKQSRRTLVPVVQPVSSTKQLAQRLDDATVIVLHEDADQWLADVSLPASGRVALVIGPEGGIGPDELVQLESSGATTVKVAQHVLRTSTAGVVALAQLQAMVRRG